MGTSTTFTGTPVFMAPEILSGNPYTKESDIFSLGTTIYTMCMLRVPFQSIDIIQLRVRPHLTTPSLLLATWGSEHFRRCHKAKQSLLRTLITYWLCGATDDEARTVRAAPG